MVGAVLVQNTRWKNVEAAIRSLRSAECLTPEAISLQGLAGLGTLIRPAGCQSVKARRLKALADWVDDIGGIRRITRIPSGQLRKGLLSVHGIGSETADAILCFGFDRQTFIADRYARRWLGRMGVTGPEALISYERCRQFFGPQLENRKIDLADLHAAIVLHGQSVCGSIPNCAGCPIRSHCLYKESETDSVHLRAAKSKLPHRSGARYLKDVTT